MKLAIVLAAGYGSRMRPNSARVPKPMLRIGRESLLIRHLRALDVSGHTHAVVTCSYHSQTLRLLVGRLRFDSLKISFSHEGHQPLETAGGIRRVMSQYPGSPVTVVNGDILTEFPFSELGAPPVGGAHLLLVPNPPHNPLGDFCLSKSGVVSRRGTDAQALTFSGVSSFDSSALETGDSPRLADALSPLIEAGLVTGQYCDHLWQDVGTPDAMHALNS